VSPLVLLLLIGGRLAHRAAPGEPDAVSVGQCQSPKSITCRDFFSF